MKKIRRDVGRIWDEVEGEAGMLAGMGILLALIETVVYMMQIDRSRFAICLLDPFAMVSYTAGVTMVPLGALMGMFLLREEFRMERLVRMQKKSRIWLGACIKIAVAALWTAVVCTLWCGILGKITANATYTWNDVTSIYYFITGRVAEAISYEKVCWYFFAGIFFAVWASGMVVLFSYWLSGSYVWGMLIVIVFSAIGTFNHYPYDFYRGAGYFIVSESFQWKYQIILPIIVVFVCVGVGFWMQRKDFLLKEKQGE